MITFAVTSKYKYATKTRPGKFTAAAQNQTLSYITLYFQTGNICPNWNY